MGHLQEQADHVLGHAELNQSRAQLFVRQLDILEARLADGFADDGRSFGHIQVALAEEFVCLLALKLGVKKEFRNCSSDVLRGDHRDFEIGPQGASTLAHGLNRVHLRECVFHKVAGAQMQDVGPFNTI